MENPTVLAHPSIEDAILVFFYKTEEKQFYFRGPEAAKSLGYKNQARSIRQHVRAKWIVEIDDGTARGKPVLYLTEPGFYELAFRSTLEQAAVFTEWVFDDVLRSIREKGGYIQPTVSDQQFNALKGELYVANQKMALQEELISLERLTGNAAVSGKIYQCLSSWDFRLNQPHQRKWYQENLDFASRQWLRDREALMQQEQRVKTLQQQLEAIAHA